MKMADYYTKLVRRSNNLDNQDGELCELTPEQAFAIEHAAELFVDWFGVVSFNQYEKSIRFFDGSSCCSKDWK